MLPYDISVDIPDHYFELAAWLAGYAIGGSILGGMLFNIISRSHLLRALGSRIGMLAGIGYWLIYHTGFVTEREALRLWDRYGAPALETVLAALGSSLG